MTAYQGPHLHAKKGIRSARQVEEGRGKEGTDQVAQKSMMTSLSPLMMVLKDSNDSIAATIVFLMLSEGEEGKRRGGRRGEDEAWEGGRRTREGQ